MLRTKTLRVIVQFRFSFFQCRRSFSNLKILYFGTDNFSLNSLKRLSNENPSRLEVVTSFRARNNPIKAFADKMKLPVHDWEVLSRKENNGICREFDLGLVVSFGHLIPGEIIDSFQLGMLNVHASLLPKYRGASPIIYAIKNGEKETGVSIMRIKPKKFDVGEILATRKVQIDNNVMMPELHDKLSLEGAELLVECVRDLDNCKPIEQDGSHASYAPKVDNEFCKVRWSEMTTTEVFNLYRSTYSFKNLQTTFINETVKLVEISRHDSSQEINRHSPGHLTFCKKSKKLLVECSDEKFVEVKQLTIGKKKAMSAADFNNGFLKKCSEDEKCFR